MKRNDDQITFKLSRLLRNELEGAAVADGRDLSGLIRKVLIDYASARICERSKQDKVAA